MRPLIASLPICLGLVVTLAAQGCGGSRIRDKDAARHRRPRAGARAAASGSRHERSRRGRARQRSAPGRQPTGARRGPGARSRRPRRHQPRPRRRAPRPRYGAASPHPAPRDCGGVTCPALFELVHPCRPMGGCMLNALVPVPVTFCYANGIKVVGESILPPDLVGLVKRADGTDCYRARITRTPAAPIATSSGRPPPASRSPAASSTAPATAPSPATPSPTPLTDPTCVAIPSPQAAPPASAFKWTEGALGSSSGRGPGRIRMGVFGSNLSAQDCFFRRL